MPPVMAAIPAAVAAAGAITLEGLAVGATIVGTGAKLVGMATGSKTLQKIGDGFSMAGGLGLAGSSLSGASKASSVTGTASKSKGLLQTDNIDDALSAPNKARAAEEGLSTFTPGKTGMSSADSFKQSAANIGTTAPSFDPELEKGYLQRANETLTKYNPLMNIAGGMGEAYMMNQRMDLEKDLLDKRLNFDQQLVDRVKNNNGTPSNFNPAFEVGRNTQAYTGLLGR